MSSVRRSFAWNLLDNYIGIALQLISTLVIARLLTPTEIGIYAVAAVLGAMANQFRDFGLGEYLIQERELTDRKIRAAFGVNMALSWTMAAVFFFSSTSVATFYGQAGVGEVMRLQSINFLLVPFGAITMAYFRREMTYRPLFIAGVCSSVVVFIVGVGGALAGLSYMALAWSSLAGLVVTVVVSVAFRPRHYPRLPSLAGVREVIAFSKHAMGIYLFGQIGKNAPEAIIGRVLDMASVAFYSRANGLMEIFNRTVLRAALPICLPYFSQQVRDGQPAAPGYLKATTLLTGVGWPFFVFVGFMAFSAIRLLYGPQWMEAVPLAQVLCLVAMLELPYWLATEVMIAAGRIDQSNRLQFLVQSLRVAGLLLVLPFGLLGAGWGLCIAAIAGAVASHRFLRQVIGLRFRDVVRACRPSAIVAVVSGIPGGLVTVLVVQSHDNFVMLFFLAGLATLVFWLAALRTVGHPFWEEIVLLVQRLRRRGPDRDPVAP